MTSVPAPRTLLEVKTLDPEQVLVPRELFERALTLVREQRIDAEVAREALERESIAEAITAMTRDRDKFLEGQLAAYRMSGQNGAR